jgi:formyltetrahydrofolate-dependent phosphoribosylglycinamide formyltransferase
MDRSRLAVFISGNGTNLQAILDACADGRLPAEVVLVVSDRAGAYGLKRAEQAGVATLVLERQKDQGRTAYDAVLAEQVAASRPDWVVLAGWMRILTMQFLGRFPGRVLNLHPALPGAFPGTHAIERAYQAWQRGEIDRSGVMVHLVPDEGVDLGPVLASEEVLFRAGESLEEFEARIHEVEHRLLVETVRAQLR